MSSSIAIGASFAPFNVIVILSVSDALLSSVTVTIVVRLITSLASKAFSAAEFPTKT